MHQRFRPEHVEAARAEHPGIEIIVHPECAHDVVELADRVGSTERILEWVRNAPAGAAIAIGTEIHMVQRLAREHADKTIVSLDPLICPCSTMFRIDVPHLAWVLGEPRRGNGRQPDRRRRRHCGLGAHGARADARHHLIAEFDDPRLVAIYDAVNAYGDNEQPDFYAQVAADMGAVSIVELGCGTGLVSRKLAALGYQVTGVDPSAAMLDVARRGPGAEHVRWICGDASALDASAGASDMAFMSGHVAQFFVSDESWTTALDRAPRRATTRRPTLVREPQPRCRGNGSAGRVHGRA